MGVDDKEEFQDFVNYLKGRGSYAINRSGKVTVQVKKQVRVQKLVASDGKKSDARTDVKAMKEMKQVAGVTRGQGSHEVDQEALQESLARSGSAAVHKLLKEREVHHFLHMHSPPDWWPSLELAGVLAGGQHGARQPRLFAEHSRLLVSHRGLLARVP